MDRRLVARQQLTATATAHRGADAEQQEPAESGREQVLDLAPAAGMPVTQAGATASAIVHHEEHGHRQGGDPRSAYGLGAEPQEVAEVGATDPRSQGVSPGAHGRPRWSSSAASISATLEPPAQHDRGAAGLQREVAQVRREQDAGAAGARVGDHLEGGLDADRVDAVEGLVEQQDVGLVQGREHDD